MPVRILQLTDCHLFADPEARLKEICVRDSFERVLAAVNQRFASADRLIITGDLTHDEQLATYELLRDRLANWLPRLRVIPGNHDDRRLMRCVFGERIETVGDRNAFVDDVGAWRLIGLDSQLPGQVSGELGPEQLIWLERQLQDAISRPACLFLHHPPVEVGSPWLDRIGLEDAASFRDLVRRFPHIRAVVCGHIHQELTAVLDSRVTVLATPSTGVQFRAETETLEVDAAAPGFRILELHPDGTLRTRVERVF